MLIWFAVMSIVLTFVVFRSPAIDYRLVALGGVLPVIELPIGTGPLHSLLAPTVVLGVVMLTTTRSRLTRRRWLGLPIGMYLHLVLDFAWARSEVFWWPFLGVGIEWGRPFEVERGVFGVVLELVAILVGAWAYKRFGLEDPELRRRFITSGQLDRSVMGPGAM